MLSATTLLVLFFALRVAAHGGDWFQTLPKCWQSCFQTTEDGCSSSKCEPHPPSDIVLLDHD
jgi:hypothetical protein